MVVSSIENFVVIFHMCLCFFCLMISLLFDMPFLCHRFFSSAQHLLVAKSMTCNSLLNSALLKQCFMCLVLFHGPNCSYGLSVVNCCECFSFSDILLIIPFFSVDAFLQINLRHSSVYTITRKAVILQLSFCFSRIL